MSFLRLTYLVLAIVGALVPLWFLVPIIAEDGGSFSGSIAKWKSDPSSAALYWQHIIAALAMTVFVSTETYVRKNWIALPCIPITWVLGLSCGLPLYMFIRYRPVT